MAQEGSDFCYQHDPARDAERDRIRLGTPKQVVRALEDVWTDVRSGALKETRGKALAYIGSQIYAGMRLEVPDEKTKKADDLTSMFRQLGMPKPPPPPDEPPPPAQEPPTEPDPEPEPGDDAEPAPDGTEGE